MRVSPQGRMTITGRSSRTDSLPAGSLRPSATGVSRPSKGTVKRTRALHLSQATIYAFPAIKECAGLLDQNRLTARTGEILQPAAGSFCRFNSHLLCYPSAEAQTPIATRNGSSLRLPEIRSVLDGGPARYPPVRRPARRSFAGHMPRPAESG